MQPSFIGKLDNKTVGELSVSVHSLQCSILPIVLPPPVTASGCSNSCWYMQVLVIVQWMKHLI